jgi:hypothetical protein
LDADIKAMTTAERSERLVAKLQFQAELEQDKQMELERKGIVERNVRKPETVTQACRRKVSDLRSKSEAFYEEVYQRKLLAIAEEQLTRANMALMQASRTPQERKELEEESLRGRILFSKIIPELSLDWRSQKNSFAEYYRQQMTGPGGKRKS